MKILLTGSEGMLGKKICDYYGDNIIPIDRKSDISDTMVVNTDMVINNAAMTNISRVEDFSTYDFEAVIDINLTVPFRIIRDVLRRYRDSNCNHRLIFINIVSMGAHYALRCSVAYCVSKAGLVTMTKQMARECVSRFPNVYFYSISPSGMRESEDKIGGMLEYTIDEMLKVRSDEFKSREEVEKYVVNSPSGSLMNASEVVDVIDFLLEHGTVHMSGMDFQFRNCGV